MNERPRGEKKRKEDMTRAGVRARARAKPLTLSRPAAGPTPESGASYGTVPQGIGPRPADSHPSTALPSSLLIHIFSELIIPFMLLDSSALPVALFYEFGTGRRPAMIRVLCYLYYDAP